jgi:hypothetical protein
LSRIRPDADWHYGRVKPPSAIKRDNFASIASASGNNGRFFFRQNARIISDEFVSHF